LTSFHEKIRISNSLSQKEWLHFSWLKVKLVNTVEDFITTENVLLSCREFSRRKKHPKGATTIPGESLIIKRLDHVVKLLKNGSEQF
jgi:hypothetical protein